jgi:AcrR family transcriptional regulator
LSKKKKQKNTPEVNPIYASLLSFEPRRRDLRKAAIVEASIRAIHRLGIEETNFETIGKLSGMGRAHVKYYFKDRSEIIQAAISFVATTAQMVTLEYISRAKSPRERLQAIVDGAVHWAHQYPEHLSVLGLNYYYCIVDKKYRAAHTEIRKLGADRVLAILIEMHSLGELKKQKHQSFEDLAKMIQNLILGTLVDWGTTSSATPLKKIQSDLMTAIDSWLD